MQSIVRSLERLTVGVGVFASILLVPLVLATTWEVISRYALGSPTIWAYEIGYTLTGSHFLLALAYTLQKGEHIRIDVLAGVLSKRTRCALDAFVYALLIPLLCWLCWALFNYALTGYVRGENSGQSALNMPVWPFRAVMFIAFVTLVLQLISEFIKSVLSLSGKAGAAHA